MLGSSVEELHVICLNPKNKSVARQQTSGVSAGCHSFVVNSFEDSRALATKVSIEEITSGVAKEGDLMIVVAGKTFGLGATNSVLVDVIETNCWDEKMKYCNHK